MNNYINSGQNDEEVIKSRKKYGSNSIAEKKQNKFIIYLIGIFIVVVLQVLIIVPLM